MVVVVVWKGKVVEGNGGRERWTKGGERGRRRRTPLGALSAHGDSRAHDNRDETSLSLSLSLSR